MITVYTTVQKHIITQNIRNPVLSFPRTFIYRVYGTPCTWSRFQVETFNRTGPAMDRYGDLIDRRIRQEYDACHIFDSVFKRFFFSKFLEIFRKKMNMMD